MSRTTRWMLALLIGSAVALVRGESEPQAVAGEVQEQTDSTSASASGMVTQVASNMPLSHIVSRLDAVTSASVSARGRTATMKVPHWIVRDVPLKEALVKLTQAVPGITLYEPADRPNTYEFWDQESFKTEVFPKLVRETVFEPRHISAEDAARAIESLLTPKVSKLTFDSRTNKVFVTDLPPVLSQMQRLIEQIDVGWTSRVFRVKNADVIDLADKLEKWQTKGAPEVIADRRTRQIIVQDRAEKIAEMEMVVGVLDGEK